MCCQKELFFFSIELNYFHFCAINIGIKNKKKLLSSYYWQFPVHCLSKTRLYSLAKLITFLCTNSLASSLLQMIHIVS